MLLGDHKEAYPVKDFESLSDLVLRLLVAQLLGHHVEEGGKGDNPASVLIHFVDHILQRIEKIASCETEVKFKDILLYKTNLQGVGKYDPVNALA